MSKSNSCSLHKYFENSNKHKKFAEIVDNLCVMYVFSPKKSPGITVLVPSEKLLGEIEALADSSKHDDVHKARSMVQSLVLKAAIKTSDDWMRYSDDLPNWLNQKVPVSVAGGKVSINGQSVVIDSDFHDSSERQNLSVWLLQGDKGVGLANPESKAKVSKVLRKDAKKGSYEAFIYGGEESSSNGLRQKIANSVESAAAKSNGEATFISYTADLLKFMKSKDSESYKEKILPAVTLDSMVDFYLLVDPHCMATSPLINDISLNAWWSDARSRDVSITGAACCSEIKKDLEDCCKSTEKFGAAVDQARSDIESSGSILKSVNRAYSALSSNNIVGGVSNVYSKQYADFMQKNGDWKMLSDQLKFGIAMKSAELDSNDVSNNEKVSTLSNMIADYMSNKGRGIVRFCGLSKSNWGNLVGKDDEAHLFVNTDYFMSNSNRDHNSGSIRGGNQAARLLSCADCSLDDVANVHQFLCDKNVKSLTAQASEAHDRLKNTLSFM